MREDSFYSKLLSGMEKIYWDTDISTKETLMEISMFKNEYHSFQIAFKSDKQVEPYFAHIEVESELKEYIKIRRVVNVPSMMPVMCGREDETLERTKPGMYPDLLSDLNYQNRFYIVYGLTQSLWIDIESDKQIPAGKYSAVFKIINDCDQVIAIERIKIRIIDAELPKQTVRHIEWLYTDCLAEYYNVEVFSDQHFEIIKNYIKTAVKNGIDVVMIPVFTPPLDTYVGGERLTTQLVNIFVDDGEYRFDFTKMNQWISMCKDCGVEYFEIPHIYTQWGAKAAPKFMATVDGEYKRIFGWETNSLSLEYQAFLKQFLLELIEQLKKYEIDDKTFFHISDEPAAKDFETYMSAQSAVKEILKNFPIIDAISNVEYCSSSIIPVPSVSRAKDFIDKNIKNIWVYYCGGNSALVTNRFFSMPIYRTRIIGVQMYLNNIKGFLHWGYNFWHNRYSYDQIEPYLETSGEFFAPSGDMSLVYPKKDGTANESIRLKAMRDAFQDLRALQFCEKLYGRDFTVQLIHEGLDYEVTFKEYPKNSQYLLNLRSKVNSAIAEKIENNFYNVK